MTLPATATAVLAVETNVKMTTLVPMIIAAAIVPPAAASVMMVPAAAINAMMIAYAAAAITVATALPGIMSGISGSAVSAITVIGMVS